MDKMQKQESVAGPIAALAKQYGMDPNTVGTVLVSTIFPKGRNAPQPTRAEVEAFCVVASKYRLNPFLREIYAFPKKGGGIVPVVGIDGWLRIINNHPQFDGMEVTFETDGKKPIRAHATIYRRDRNHPTKITEEFAECVQATDPWRAMPFRMLRHKAIIQGARVAFGIGGIFDEDEAKIIAAREPEYEVKVQPPTDLDALAERLATTDEEPEEEAVDPTPDPTSDPTSPPPPTSQTEQPAQKQSASPSAPEDSQSAPSGPPQSGTDESVASSGAPSDGRDRAAPITWLRKLKPDDNEGTIKLFQIPVSKTLVHNWPIWCDGKVGGKSAMADRTWLELAQGPIDGGRYKWMTSVVGKALQEWSSERKEPSEFAQCVIVAFEVCKGPR